ncbi:MAG: prolipoprotein diacylglyceryl transferase [Elusimicrobia bacterium GWF2_52_66]|nr:MAG: prolipoprotein diacylglyceryl transferase [Elusimicrobia bacterium GWA2_51_34]OGR85169.1 MAG: prolipoprotein diacylglyceryl transferase [Elusimicrobia bacterium GWF2_52_66]HAF95515.1 prolipoprotein diacylglyceryl transferase [Elusimicrobiota bacterium]HCE98345.1 prolipoprotein diacylglyceryl transferase [Elusimicrobiota bacterium]
MHPFIFEAGRFHLPAYGLMVAAGYLAALLYLNFRAKTFSICKEKLQDLVFWTVIAGMAGAKFFYAATYWDSFGSNFLERTVYLFRTFQYGFVFYGGLIFGATAFYVKTRKNGLDFLKTADLCAPALALGHAFGRLGCFFAGCCHGRPTGSIFGVVFSDPRCEVNPEYLGVTIHPSQLYEAAGNLLIFFVLNYLLSKETPARAALGGQFAAAGGRVLAAYAALYALLRFLVEFLRGDDRGGFILGLSPAQVISLLVLISVVLYSLFTSHKSQVTGHKWRD